MPVVAPHPAPTVRTRRSAGAWGADLPDGAP